IFQHCLERALQRVTVAAAAGLLVPDHVALADGARALAVEQFARAAVHAEIVAGRRTGSAAEQAVGLMVVPVGAKLQDRLVGQQAILPDDAEAAALPAGAARVGPQG